MSLGNMEHEAKDSMSDPLAVDPLPVTQWNFLAACMFFCTGHWYVACSLIRVLQVF